MKIDDIPPSHLAFGDQVHAAIGRSVDAGTRYATLITGVCDDDMIAMIYLYTKIHDIDMSRENALMSLSLALVRLARCGGAQ